VNFDFDLLEDLKNNFRECKTRLINFAFTNNKNIYVIEAQNLSLNECGNLLEVLADYFRKYESVRMVYMGRNISNKIVCIVFTNKREVFLSENIFRINRCELLNSSDQTESEFNVLAEKFYSNSSLDRVLEDYYLLYRSRDWEDPFAAFFDSVGIIGLAFDVKEKKMKNLEVM
jgi:hypothetical protein